MSVFYDYHEEDYDVPIEPGEHLLKIVKAEEKVFNSGNEGLKIELANRQGNKFFYHIIKNDFFNKNLTRFYDCFKIRRGDANLNQWAGHYGAAYIDKGKPSNSGLSYFEIKYLIIPETGNKTSEPKTSAGSEGRSSPLNERRKQLIADINAAAAEVDPDRLPYFTEQEKKEITDTISRCGPYEQGIQALEKEKARITTFLAERKDQYKPFWEDAVFPARNGMQNDCPF